MSMYPTSSVYPLRVETQLASAILVCVVYFPRAAPLTGRRQGSPVLVDDDVHGGTPLAPPRRPQLPMSVCESAPASRTALRCPYVGGVAPPGWFALYFRVWFTIFLAHHAADSASFSCKASCSFAFVMPIPANAIRLDADTVALCPTTTV